MILPRAARRKARFIPEDDLGSSPPLMSAAERSRSVDTMKHRLLFLILIAGLLALAVGGWTVQGVRRAFALPLPA
jgi:hypothetical protein